MGYYHNYGTIYNGTFDSIPRNGEQYRRFYFEIKQKNKAKRLLPGQDPNTAINVLCSSKPAIHSFLDDSMNPYISGSELKVTLLNIDNQLPLSKFYSENDDEWMIDLYVSYTYDDDGVTAFDNQLLFRGYLVQEDCQEIVVDYTHEIELSFTDNIGLLKDVTLDSAIKQTPRFGTSPKFNNNVYIRTDGSTSLGYWFEIDWIPTSLPIIGDTMIIENTNYGNGVYTITYVEVNGTKLKVFTSDEFTSVNLTQASVRFISTYNISDTISLRDLYWICIYSTGIPLYIFFKNELREVKNTQLYDTRRILEYINIDLNTFSKSDSYDTLDDVLNKVNVSFQFTFFQSLGHWCLVRFGDLTFSFDGFRYDSQFSYLSGPTKINPNLNYIKSFGGGSDLENGLISSIERPLKYIQHTYRYEQPDLVYNPDMSNIGKLLLKWSQGSGVNIKKYENYEAVGWTGNKPVISNPSLYSPVHIEVEYDYYDTEKDRYLVLEKSTIQAYASNNVPIKLSKGDIVIVSYEGKVRNQISGQTFLYNFFHITKDPNAPIPNSTNDWLGLFFQSGNWQYGAAHPIIFPANDDSWISISSNKSKPVPYDCYAYFSFVKLPNDDWFVRNLKVQVVSIVNKAQSIKGQIHKTLIPPVIKNIEDEEIYIDDSPSWTLKGCLFTNQINGVIREKTQTWGLANQIGLTKGLGEIVCRQKHIQYGKKRLKLEGNIFPVISKCTDGAYSQTIGNDFIFSKLFKAMFLPPDPQFGLPMIFGKLDIDYKNNSANFTSFEYGEGSINIYTEPNNTTYTFKYLTE